MRGRFSDAVRGGAAAAALAGALATGPGPVEAQELSALRPGDIFTHCEIFCPEMTLAPGGSFVMGSRPEERGRDPDEGPTREVSVAPFAIAITETTQIQWDACVADGYCRPNEERLGFGRQRGRWPAAGVSWRQIVGTPRFTQEADPKPLPPSDGFLAWLNAKTPGAPYRLPTEAEWEYAARAGAQTPFHTGARISTFEANFNPTPRTGPAAEGPYRGHAVAVGSLPPNPWGLYEMPGNVWEWTEDCYRPNYQGAPDDGRAVAEEGCAERVLRGGAWLNFEIGVRAANRYKFNAEEALGGFGFRVVYDFSRAAAR